MVKIENFKTIVNKYPLTIITKVSILDFCENPGCVSGRSRKPDLTLYFPMFAFDSPENIRKQTFSDVFRKQTFSHVFRGIKREHWEENV